MYSESDAVFDHGNGVLSLHVGTSPVSSKTGIHKTISRLQLGGKIVLGFFSDPDLRYITDCAQ